MPKTTTAEHTPDSLRAMASILKDFAANLEVQAERLETYKIDAMIVTNADQRQRGMVFIEGFISAVSRAIREARDGSAEPKITLPKKKPPKK